MNEKGNQTNIGKYYIVKIKKLCCKDQLYSLN